MAGNRPNALLAATIYNLTLRFALLRFICISALILSVWITVRIPIEHEGFSTLLLMWLVFLFTPFLHHTAAAFGPRFCLPNIFDLILLILETIVWCICARGIENLTTSVDSQNIIIVTAWMWLLAISLLLYGVLRMMAIFSLGWRGLLRRLDVSSVTWTGHDGPASTVGATRSGRMPTTPLEKARTVLAGRGLWKERIPGEARWLRFFRGMVAIFAIAAITVYSCVNIVYAPVSELSLTPFSVLKSSTLPADFQLSSTPTWNMLITQNPSQNNSLDMSGLESAVTVLPLSSSKDSPCPTTSSTLKPWIDGRWVYAMTFTCPSLLSADAKTSPDTVKTIQDILPEVLITVNFTALGALSTSPLSILKNSVEIRPSFIDDAELVMRSTRPVLLLPGTNLIGTATVRVQQKYKIPALSSLGAFGPVFTFLIADIIHVYNDPLQNDAITRGPDIGTIRIAYTDFFTDWEVGQDQRNNTVLKGFASVGGIWSFMGGLFVWFFGSSLHRVLRGTKPITVFGAAHNFQRDQTIRKTCLAQYPNAISDIKNSEGLLALLHDHLLDLDLLVENNTTKQAHIPMHQSEDSDTYEMLKLDE